MDDKPVRIWRRKDTGFYTECFEHAHTWLGMGFEMETTLSQPPDYEYENGPWAPFTASDIPEGYEPPKMRMS